MKKLTLARSTVRNLSKDDLSRVPAGFVSTTNCSDIPCPSEVTCFRTPSEEDPKACYPDSLPPWCE